VSNTEKEKEFVSDFCLAMSASEDLLAALKQANQMGIAWAAFMLSKLDTVQNQNTHALYLAHSAEFHRRIRLAQEALARIAPAGVAP
jgi:hypothetical protein